MGVGGQGGDADADAELEQSAAQPASLWLASCPAFGCTAPAHVCSNGQEMPRRSLLPGLALVLGLLAFARRLRAKMLLKDLNKVGKEVGKGFVDGDFDQYDVIIVGGGASARSHRQGR